MKQFALACCAGQVFCLTACGQLLLGPGESWSYALSSLSRTGSVPSFLESPNGAFTLTVDDSTFQNGDALLYEMFEESESDTPICSAIMTSIPPSTVTCQVAGSWQDLQGYLRLTMLSGSLTVTSLTVRVVKSGPSLSSYDIYASTFAPAPGPKLSTVRSGDKLIVSWPQRGTNGYDLQVATNLSGTILWQNVTNAIYPLGTNNYSINDISAPLQIFRLRARP
jgi:hypothetical protein